MDLDDLKPIILLSYLKDDMLNKIAKVTQIGKYSEGDYIFKEGDYAKNLYAVIDGKVGLEIEKTSSTQVMIITLARGQTFGVSALVDTHEKKYMTSVKALKDTELFIWQAADLEEIFHQDYEMGFMFMKRIARIIKTRLDAIRVQSLDIYS